MVNNTFFNERMSFGDQWISRQSSSGNKNDQPNKSKCDTKIKQHIRNISFSRVWIQQRMRKDHLIKIQPVTEYDQHTHECHHGIISFGSSSHQQQNRCNEIDNEIQEENSFVWRRMTTGTNSFNKISCFFRLVAVPDQHVLGEPQICPEN